MIGSLVTGSLVNFFAEFYGGCTSLHQIVTLLRALHAAAVLLLTYDLLL